MSSKTKNALIFLFLGILALAVGVTSLSRRGSYVTVSAVITQVESEYDHTREEWDHHTYVEYSVDGQKYNGELGYYENGYEEGKEIDIRYDPANPLNIMEDSIGFTVYLTIIGPILILAGIFVFLKR